MFRAVPPMVEKHIRPPDYWTNLMTVLTYPSKSFEKEATSLIANDEEFHVIVPADSKKKEIVLEKLEKLFRGKHDGRSKLGRVVRTCRVLSFFSVLGAALYEDGYGIVFEDQGDLLILFKPKRPRVNGNSI